MATAYIHAHFTSIVKAMAIAPNTTNGASQQQAQAHVEAVLHLIYIIREAGYHRIRAELCPVP